VPLSVNSIEQDPCSEISCLLWKSVVVSCIQEFAPVPSRTQGESSLHNYHQVANLQ